MKEKIEEILNQVRGFEADSKDALENFRITYLSKKGVIPALFADFKNVTPELRKEMGMKLNELKNTVQDKVEEQLQKFENQHSNEAGFDMSMPANEMKGARHPLSIVRRDINEIFAHLGFTIAEGPEIEDDWHLFSALNFPPEHPARDMQDTFFVEKDVALRTHTSSVQIRCLEKETVPVRKIFPGRVFRNEAISARAHCMFHQVEGLYVDKNVSFKDLKQVLLYFAEEMFGPDTKIRLRPSYFPFTEPSAEMDVTCSICGGKGCNICKNSGWVEILGCGMVDPNVLKNCNIDPSVYSGYAFGMGIERISMLKYNTNDIRLYFDNDVRFLSQFKNA